MVSLSYDNFFSAVGERRPPRKATQPPLLTDLFLGGLDDLLRSLGRGLFLLLHLLLGRRGSGLVGHGD